MASSSRLHGLAEAILDEVLLWLPWQDVEASVACLGRSWVGVRSRVMGKRQVLSLSKAQCEGLAGSRFAALLSACHALTRLELGDDECANPVKRQRLDTFENISGVGNDAADMTLNDLGLVDKVLAILAENNGGDDGNGD